METIKHFKELKVWQKGIEAEGFKRYHAKEYKQFLYIALGSLAELETQIVIAKEVGLIEDSTLDSVNEKLDHISKMLSSLISKLR